MVEVFNDLDSQYTDVMAKWKAIQTTDIPAFNAKQKASGGKTIEAGPRPTSCGGRGRGGGAQ